MGVQTMGYILDVVCLDVGVKLKIMQTILF